jgi:hypothetical protein
MCPQMHLTDIQDLAIQARVANIVGAKTYDRLFSGIRFDEVDTGILIVYAKDEETADEIEDNFAMHISIVAAEILNQDVSIVLVLPKVFQ